ncbi:MAG TPA: hypothetical protein VF546_16975 [Pyrinomonadaceae bacterium]|jgi:hypothetical protein
MKVVEIELELGAEYVTRQSLMEGKTRFSLTPFDIPISARVVWDGDKSVLTIEFRYLTPHEPRKTINVNKDIEMSVGKFSYKLYSARIGNAPTPDDAINGLIQALENARRKFNVSHPKERVPYWNYSLAKDFLAEEEKGQLARLAL